jgi:hypothetical protein
MNLKELVLVRGFDLFFAGASDTTIENIAKQLGGRFSFDADEGRTTYMFETIKCVEVASLSKMHGILNNLGNMFAATYDCQYEFSEFYVTVSDKSKRAA